MPLNPDKKYHSRYFHFLYTLQALEAVRGKILDIGCGQGAITATIKKKRNDLSLFACDHDKKALEVFKKNHPRLKIKLKKADAHQLPLRGNQFAAIIMIDVLEHLKNPRKAVSEASRVLAKGGIFHLVVPLEAELSNFDGWLRLFGINLKEKPIGHIHQFNLKEIKKLLSKNGFKIIQIRFSYHFFYQLLSFAYFAYLGVFKKGKYLPLDSEKRSLNKLISLLNTFVSWLFFLESKILAKVKGQTAHITAIKK